MNSKLKTFRLFSAAAILFSGLSLSADAADRKPDIVIISAKEFAGKKTVPTPDIDLLFAGSATFATAYSSAPLAGPANAALLTGRSPQRYGFDANAEGNIEPTDRGPRALDSAQVTLAQRLKDAGYATGAFGDWYLGSGEGYLPTQRGFDEFYGTITPVRRSSIYRGAKLDEVIDNPLVHFERYESEALSFIDHQSAQASDQPFFVYIAVTGEPAQLDDLVKQVTGRLHDRHADDNALVVFLNHHTEQWHLYDRDLRSDIAINQQRQIWTGQSFSHLPVSDLDIAPTVLAAAGVEVKPEWKLDGENLMPLLNQGQTATRDTAFFWRFGVQSAVRQGDWKLVKSNATATPSLFNLAEDPKESHDLFKQQPQRAAELLALWDKWNAGNEQPRWIDDHWNGATPESEDVASAPDNGAKGSAKGPWSSGDKLAGNRAPRIGGKPLEISADLDVTGTQGVAVSFGGATQGFAVYLIDGKLAFAVRENGQLTTIKSDQPIGNGHYAVGAKVARDGTLTLLVNGKPVAQGKASGPIPQQPRSGLSVGDADFGSVGDYQSPSAFSGKVSNVQIKALGGE